MSSLAQHLLKLGCVVTGSDRAENEQTAKLRKLGATVYVPHNAQNVGNAKLVVKTSAVPQDNPEVQFALDHNIPVILREQLLGELFDGFSERIAVCGTHGKTTVTAMLHHVLERCGVSHAAFIGGEYEGENYFNGVHTVVAEACEYNRSFLQLHPTVCVCLNVEFDHPDCYKNQADVEQSFEKLFAQSEKVVLSSVHGNLWRGAEFFGERGVTAANVTSQNGRAHFDLLVDGEYVCRTKLSVCGVHNVKNALAVVAAAKILKLPLLQVAQALYTFRGVDRRWTEHNGRLNVVCDYAHHPTEIETSVHTAKSLCKGRVICVFQPHTYSRTLAFFPQFVSCFDGADQIVYLPVYSAREKPIRGATAYQLYRRAKIQGKNAKYFSNFTRCAEYLKRIATQDDMIVLVGAGDVNKLAQYL